jgi:uncharacterized membrane protein (DUF485 family)
MSYLGGPLTNLAPATTEIKVMKDEHVYVKSNTMNFIVWFLGIFIVLVLAMWVVKPAFILHKDMNGDVTAQVNCTNLFAIAAVLALVVIAAIYLLKAK